MTLSKQKEQLKDRIFMKDIFLNHDPEHVDILTGRVLWMALAKAKIHLHPVLQDTFLRQRTCFFCGDVIVTYKVDETNSEERCAGCGYVYGEQ